MRSFLHTLNTLGTLARTVRDAVYALDAIYGIDPLTTHSPKLAERL